MPHSLRVRIKRMKYKGYITDNDCQRLCDALDMEQAVKDAITEINSKIVRQFDGYNQYDMAKGDGYEEAIKIIKKHTGVSECSH